MKTIVCLALHWPDLRYKRQLNILKYDREKMLSKEISQNIPFFKNARGQFTSDNICDWKREYI
jgi:hypothetical protein